MARLFGMNFGFDGLRRNVRPQQTAGVTGARVVGGMVDRQEKDSRLAGANRYLTFSEVMVNTSIVGAGIRHFLNLCGKSAWQVEPVDDGDAAAVEAAEFVEDVIDQMEVSWRRVVRRTAMFRFHGFSIHEWTAVRRPDGRIGYAKIEHRPQRTITRWDMDEDCNVRGIVQQHPLTSEELYLPRGKVMYVVDDAMSDSPEGLGLFRHMAKPAERLDHYLWLEQMGFETDIRGIPLIRAPLAELQGMVAAGTLKKEEADKLIKPLETFLENHIKNPKSGMIMDSDVYKTIDEKGAPSTIPKYDLSVVQAANTVQGELASAIERTNRELAWLMGVEHFLLGGGGGGGSLALSKDKSQNFYLSVDAAQTDIAEAARIDILGPLWKMNGLDPALMPFLKPEAVRFKDVEEMAAGLRDMAAAGAVLDPDDPAIGVMRDLMGLPRPVMDRLLADAAVTRPGARSGEPDPDLEADDGD